MKVFLAGATGAIGRRLLPLLRAAGHDVVGTTRRAERCDLLRRLGAVPVVVDAYDAAALTRAVADARPDVIVHQLTDLPQDPAAIKAALDGNARLRIEGTRNLVAAALAARVRRMVAQSIAFAYAPGPAPLLESHPLHLDDAAMGRTAQGVAALEQAVTQTPGLDGVVLRYGRLYGPGTWTPVASGPAPLHVDAAAQAALLALTQGAPGIYNIAEDDGAVSSEKARRALGFDASFRLPHDAA